jgi:hypothetical protein
MHAFWISFGLISAGHAEKPASHRNDTYAVISRGAYAI